MDVGEKAASNASISASSNVIMIGSSIHDPLRRRQGPVTLTNLAHRPVIGTVTVAVTVDVDVFVFL